jgi:hypothetical protein
MIAKLLEVGLTRRLLLRSPFMGAIAAAAPKSALPKPRREIDLVRTFVAGTAYYDAERAMDGLGVGQELVLRREPKNPHDSRAIEVLAPWGSKLGYVPRSDNSAVTALMDDARTLRARITALRPGAYRDICMSIALVE